MIVLDNLPQPIDEPPRGTRVVLPTGRIFVNRVDHPEFHWADGVGWYRWREVQRRMAREGGRIEPAEGPA